MSRMYVWEIRATYKMTASLLCVISKGEDEEGGQGSEGETGDEPSWGGGGRG